MDSEVIKELIKLEEKLEYCFIDRELLKQSLTHPAVNPVRNFEPLEFLGDSLLGSCLAVLIYNRIQTTDEGLLSRYRGYMASHEFLVRITQKLDLYSTAFCVNQRKELITERTICDIFEAIIGACYLDSSFETVMQVIKRLFMPFFPQLNEVLTADPKSTLQEWCHSKGLPLPVYSIVSQEGPEHNTTYTVCVSLPTGETFEGKGPSKKVAEKNAAFEALRYLRV